MFEERKALDAQEAAEQEARHFAANCDLLRTKQVRSARRGCFMPQHRLAGIYAEKRATLLQIATCCAPS